MMRYLYEIGYEADPEDISRVRTVPCRRCHGLNHQYQWVDLDEWAIAAANAFSNNLPIPSNEGGAGYSKLLAPHESCPHCLGAGQPVVTVTDTSALQGASRKLFVAARQKANGEVEIELEDRHAARQELHRLLGLITNKSESRSVTVHVEPLKDLSPDAVLEFMTANGCSHEPARTSDRQRRRAYDSR